MVVLALVAAAVRVPVVLRAFEVTHGDAGIVYLMMRRIWTGEDFPLLYYGQRYMGAIDPAMAAPIHGLLGPRVETLAAAQALIFCALALPLAYRLFREIASPGGAFAGGVLFAIGTPWFVACTTGRYTGYLSTLWLGTLVLTVAHRALERPGGPGIGSFTLVGFLLGLGYYNNPQVVLFGFPIALALWLRSGRVPALRAAAGVRAALGTTRSWVFGALFAALAIGLVACAMLCVHQQQRWPPWEWSAGPLQLRIGGASANALAVGPLALSLGSPENYIPKLLVLAAALVLALELVLALDRSGWLARAGACGVAFAVGVSPLAIGLAGDVDGRSAPLDINPAIAFQRLADLRYARLVWLGDGEIEDETMPPAWFRGQAPPTAVWHESVRAAAVLLRAGAIVVWTALLASWVVARRRVLWSVLRLRACALDPLDSLVVQQLAFLALYLQHPVWAAGRYFVFGWLMLGGLGAWATRRLVLAQGRRLAIAAVALLGLHYGLVAWVFTTQRVYDGRRLPNEAHLPSELETRGLRYGLADYALVHHLSYLSDERLVLVNKRGWEERFPERMRQLVQHRGRTFRLVADWVGGDVENVDGHDLSDFLDTRVRPVDRRWRRGPCVIYEFEKTGPGFD